MTCHRVRLLARGLVLVVVCAAPRLTLGLGQGGGGVTTSGQGSGGNIVVISSAPVVLAPLDPGTGAISGTVVDGTTGAPLAGVFVTLAMQPRASSQPSGQRRVGQQVTDAKGRFVFIDLPASDSYLLSARKFAYFDGAFGAQPGSATGTRVFLSEGAWFNKAEIRLWPTGAVTGTVIDDHGDPIVGAYVRVLRQVMVAGKIHLAPAAPVTTDDRGAYRIAGLDPGTYLVCAPSVQASVPATSGFDAEPTLDLDRNARLVVGRYPLPPARADVATAYGTACYPDGTSMPQAAPVTVRFGGDVTGIDIKLRATPAFRVAGHADSPTGAAPTLTLRLLPAGSQELGQGSEAATALVAADGSFVFLNVPIGEYVLDARGTTAQYEYAQQSASVRFSALPRPPTPGVSSYGMSGMDVSSGPPRTTLKTTTIGSPEPVWGRTTVVVDGRDITDVHLSLQPAATMSGRLVFETQTPPTQGYPFVQVVAEPADGNPGQLTVRTWQPGDPTEQLILRGVSPGQYVLRVRASGSWTVRSVTTNGRDVTRTPIDIAGRDIGDVVITLIDTPATVAGTVRGSDGIPVGGAAVIVFPAEPSGWAGFGITPDRIKSAFVDNVGEYRITGLPAGDYLLIAVDPAQAAAWQDPAWLELASRGAARVSVGWSDTKTMDLVKQVAR